MIKDTLRQLWEQAEEITALYIYIFTEFLSNTDTLEGYSTDCTLLRLNPDAILRQSIRTKISVLLVEAVEVIVNLAAVEVKKPTCDYCICCVQLYLKLT